MSFDTYRVALTLNVEMMRVIDLIRPHHAELANQIKRATCSIVLNVAEGAAQSGGHRAQRYETAHGSAREVRAGLEVAIAMGWIEESDPVWRLIDRQCALLFRVRFPKQKPAPAGSSTS